MTDETLPLPDYDQLPIGSVQHRIRSLAEDQLRTLIHHERRHANRVPVLEILTARLDQLEAGATPSGGRQPEAPEVTSTPGGSHANPSRTREDNTPLRHGVAGQTPARGRP
jgi:hypothetical protein